MIVTALGLGMTFLPITLLAPSPVPDRDAGLAASLPNIGQQVGGAIGLALLGSVAWGVVATTVTLDQCRHQHGPSQLGRRSGL